MSTRNRLPLIAIFLLIHCGCGSQPSAAFRRSQTQALESAVSAYEEGDAATAEQLVTQALTETALNADQVESAYLLRAKARIEIEDYEGAQEDLDLVEQYATNPEELLVVKGQLLAKQGDQAGAELAFRNAKKLNSNVTIPEVK